MLAIDGNIVQSIEFGCEQKQGKIRSQDLENNRAMEQFLSGVEKRAYRIAQIATKNSDDAFDIVQDAMFKLVEKYANKKQVEWGPLFHCILQSRIRDWHRRSKVRNRFRVWFSFTDQAGDEVKEDFIQTAEDPNGRSPEALFETEQDISSLEEVLQALPLRQQQAFLLRAWEGLSVKQTAQAMKCSEGSVKTHYSRANQRLRVHLGGQ